MARGVQIAFTLNPRDFIKGLKSIDVELDDVVDALDEAEQAANDAFDDLDTDKAERGLKDVSDAAEDAKDELSDIKDGADDAERALSDLGSEAKSELGKVETAAQQAGAEVESEIEGGARDAEDAFAKLARGAKSDMAKVERAVDGVDRELGDVEDEANASAKEFGASFRGDPVEALEEVQSYLAEIVSVKLPGFAGAAATIAGGAVLGLVVAGVEQWREKQERINEIATNFIGIIQEAVDGPLSQTNRAYDDLIDKQLTLAVLEEASAAQLADLATLAAARGETTEEYVNGILTGEISTQEELKGIQAERNAIADELLRITTDNNTENDDQIPILQAQDAALQEQGESLRSVGGFINENKAGYDRAKAAQDKVNDATVAGQEAQRAKNVAAGAAVTIAERTAARVRDISEEVKNVPDLTIKTEVQRKELDDALADARAGANVPVWLRVQNQNAIQSALGGSLAGNQNALRENP